MPPTSRSPAWSGAARFSGSVGPRHYPRVNERLGIPICPDPHEIAEALGRLQRFERLLDVLREIERQINRQPNLVGLTTIPKMPSSHDVRETANVRS